MHKRKHQRPMAVNKIPVKSATGLKYTRCEDWHVLVNEAQGMDTETHPAQQASRSGHKKTG
jgi:hypothetical protein